MIAYQLQGVPTMDSDNVWACKILQGNSGNVWYLTWHWRIKGWSHKLKRVEAAVKKAMCAVNGVLNPFNVNDKTHLHVISSGSPVSEDIEVDVMRA